MIKHYILVYAHFNDNIINPKEQGASEYNFIRVENAKSKEKRESRRKPMSHSSVRSGLFPFVNISFIINMHINYTRYFHRRAPSILRVDGMFTRVKFLYNLLKSSMIFKRYDLQFRSFFLGSLPFSMYLKIHDHYEIVSLTLLHFIRNIEIY